MPSPYNNVPPGPFSFPRFGGVPGAGGVSLTSTPFRPAAQVVGSPQNAVNLAAAQIPRPAVAAAPLATGRPPIDPRLLEMMRRMQMMPGYNQQGGGGGRAASAGYSSSSGRSVGSQGLG